MVRSPRPVLSALLILIALMAGPLAAGPPPNITPQEVDLIPQWCPSYTETLGVIRPARDPMVVAKINKLKRSGCSGIHHYCWALVRMNRFVLDHKLTPAEGKFLLTEAIADIDYGIRNSKPSCSIQAEMHAKTGEIFGLLGDHPKAEDAYKKAFKYQKNYARSYIGIADLYELRGNPAQAIAVLEEGIKANPRSSALRRKLARVKERHTKGSAPDAPVPEE